MKVELENKGNELLVKIEGRLDTTTAPELESQLMENVKEDTKKLVLDMENLDYVSSAGLRVILSAHKKMAAQDGELEVLHVKEAIMEVFEITGFADILTIK